MNKDYFLKQLIDILGDFHDLESRAKYMDFSDLPAEHASSVLTKAKSAIERIVGSNSQYFIQIEEILKKDHIGDGDKLRTAIGSIKALKNDLEKGYLKSLSDIVQSEVFSDYLEMAEHLIEEGYKDPAAVIVGSTLESHLRKLCNSHSIAIEELNAKGKTIPKSADKMNSELTKSGAYSSLYQKQVLSLLALRNSAAHGKYNDYSFEQVKLMLQSVRQFILATTL
jgi:hypothetical protein